MNGDSTVDSRDNIDLRIGGLAAASKVQLDQHLATLLPYPQIEQRLSRRNHKGFATQPRTPLFAHYIFKI